MDDNKTPQPAENHQPHAWPPADEAFCSCCRGPIVSGLDNVLRIITSPEKVLSTSGLLLGEENRKPAERAFLHARCAKRHFGMQVECDKCGVLSRAKILSNGQKNQCGCTCHDGSNHCSFILDPNANPNLTRKT